MTLFELSVSSGGWCVSCQQVLDERRLQGQAGALFHQHDDPGRPGVCGRCDALPGLPGDPHQGRVEAEPRGFLQYLGPQLPLRDNLGFHLP